MKSILPGNQVALGSEPSFGREDWRESAEPSSPYDTYPKAKPRSEELIDLTKRQPQDPQDPYEGRTRFNFDPQNNQQGSGGDERRGEEGRATYHFGEGAAKPSLAPPPKPKRDWSSLSHEYANISVGGGGRMESAEKEHIRTQLRDFVNVKMRQEGSGGVIAHVRQGSGDSQHQHLRQSSTDSTDKNSEFLDTQMAKLLERKGHSRDETDSGVSQRLQADPQAMRRSKSGEISRGGGGRGAEAGGRGGEVRGEESLRPESLSLVRSISGEVSAARNPEILDEDTRKMLKDCQEYLQSTEGSPRGSVGRAARSLHSSPGNSYTKYGGSQGQLNRSHSGHLNLSPPGPIQKSPSQVSSSPGGGHRPGREDCVSLHSEASEGSKHSPHNETGPSSLEDGGPGPEYQNVDRRVEAQVSCITSWQPVLCSGCCKHFQLHTQKVSYSKSTDSN